MATKKVDEKKTLKYAVAFYFCTSGKINFMLGNKMYQHINTVYLPCLLCIAGFCIEICAGDCCRITMSGISFS